MPKVPVPSGYEAVERYRWEVHQTEGTRAVQAARGIEDSFVRLVIQPGETWGTLHLVLFQEDDEPGAGRMSIALEPLAINQLWNDLRDAYRTIWLEAVQAGMSPAEVAAWVYGNQVAPNVATTLLPDGSQ